MNHETRTPDFGAATLNDCDREPIHVPGSVQSHSCIVSLVPGTDRIAQAGGDFRRILGVEGDGFVGSTLADLVGPTEASRIIGAEIPDYPQSTPLKTYEVEIETPAGPVDAVTHSHHGIPIIEFETARRGGGGGLGDTLHKIQRMLAAMNSTGGFTAYCRQGARMIRETTGFDRVMVYQFLPDGSGKVIADERHEDMESFLDLHYPETDIPKQARELYRSNWVRMIPDVDYRPQPIEPPLHPTTGAPLDLSFAVSRSVSPLHVQYLRNMGVAASMSISILKGGELWGLFACHHRTPHLVPCDVRAACELFGQIFSLQLESKLHAEDYEYDLQQRSVHTQMVRRLSEETRLADGLIKHRPNLLDYIHAEGVAIVVDGEYSEIGRTPGQARVQRIVEALNEREDGVFASDAIATWMPDAEEFMAEAAGVLALSVSRRPRDYILWFRPEIVQEVSWAGNPQKAVIKTDEGERLSPRNSFQAWRQTVRGRSRPWKPVEVKAVEALRLSILETVLKRIDEIARERAKNEERQALLLAELDHRVKNTLANIQALMRHSESDGATLKDYVTSLERRIKSMAYAHSLLSESRWEGAGLRRLAEEEFAQFAGSGALRTRIAGPEITLDAKAALALSLMLHELATNAAKHGALSSSEGHVDLVWEQDAAGDLRIAWREMGGPTVVPPTRIGFGRQLIENAIAYELNSESDLRFVASGVECDIRIPASFVVGGGARDASGSDESGEVSGPLTVLVVEDSMITAMDLDRLLKRLGHEVCGPTGRVDQAMALIQERSIDVAILDINLGNVDSFGIADRLTESGIPFFFLSGYDPKSVLPLRFAEIPCLGKPFDEAQVSTAILSAHRRRARS
jgi:light-regulated signal transduction histidine kinase (bacteriophytochrome)